MGITTDFLVYQNKTSSEDNFYVPNISTGSPLVTKNQASLDYQSVLKYMNKNFDTYNLLRLDHKFSGLKRRMDFSDLSESSTLTSDQDRSISNSPNEEHGYHFSVEENKV